MGGEGGTNAEAEAELVWCGVLLIEMPPESEGKVGGCAVSNNDRTKESFDRTRNKVKTFGQAYW